MHIHLPDIGRLNYGALVYDGFFYFDHSKEDRSKWRERKIAAKKNWKKILQILSFVIILLYPLRHVHLGVDLWDSGYNYANFRYAGPEYMDSMWYFATWAANAFGNMLTRLPWGDTMIGMNVYTSLVIGIIAAGAYLFCAKKLHIPAWVAFMGEIIALSLCWTPSAVLYSYLTYGIMLAGVICLYQALVHGKERYFVIAGVLLGLNVGVRFSNLVEVGFILVVWFDAILLHKKFSQVIRQTGLCILGYLCACGGFLLLIALKYGLGYYIESVLRLFSMTEHAKDYTALAMLSGIGRAFWDSSYWVKRFAVAVLASLVCCVLLPKKWTKLKKGLTVLITILLFIWLLTHRYCTRDFFTYESIYFPCIIFFEMAAVLSLVQMFDRRAGREMRLQALLVVLIVYLSSLGSNNAVYASINNLFLVLPIFLWMTCRFLREYKHIIFFPFKTVLVFGLLLLASQGIQFGAGYIYEEATGARDVGTEIRGVPVLQGIYTNKQKAEQITMLYDYLQGSGLADRECILYGGIPGLSYYMELKPAMNIWSDLNSYSLQIQSEKIQEIGLGISSEKESPLIILEKGYYNYLDTGETSGLEGDELAWQKFQCICEFMNRYGYFQDYFDGKFAVYRMPEE